MGLDESKKVMVKYDVRAEMAKMWADMDAIYLKSCCCGCDKRPISLSDGSGNVTLTCHACGRTVTGDCRYTAADQWNTHTNKEQYDTISRLLKGWVSGKVGIATYVCAIHNQDKVGVRIWYNAADTWRDQDEIVTVDYKTFDTLAEAIVWAVGQVSQRLVAPGYWYISRQKETLSISSISSYGKVIEVDLPPVDLKV